MPQANIFQSQFTGQEMDERFTAVAQLTAALEALTAVVAQKYVKPASGIPSTDMDADVQAALAKANTAVQSLAEYYTKSEVNQLLEAINGMDYVDVAALPEASASTMGKIYLLGPDGSGYYAYYYTSYDGSAYSWVGPLGTTQISLANYATKEELGQLRQKVDEKTPETVQDGLHFVDESLNVVMQYTSLGFDVALLAPHFIQLLRSSLNDNIAIINESCFAVVDEGLNIGFAVDNNGVRAKNTFNVEIV